MKRQTPLLALLALGGSLAIVLASCAGSESLEDQSCRPGLVLTPDGRCINPGQPGRGTDPDASPSPSGNDDTSQSTTTSSDSCTPGATTCITPLAHATCNELGTGHDEPQPCDEDHICADREDGATCILGEDPTCDPGDFVTCSGTTRWIRCGDDGFPESGAPLDCPASTPSCRAGLGCSDAVCNPGQSTCSGNQVARCDENGQPGEFIRSCSAGCQNGDCIDPCATDDKGDHVGCSFYAVFLDNFPGECTQSCPTGSVCRSGRCEYETVSNDRFGVTVSNVGEIAVDVSVYGQDNTVVGTASVNPGDLAYIPVPIPPGWGSGSRVERGHTFRIESTGAVTIHQFNPPRNINAFSNDASLLLPINSLGSAYTVLNWPSHQGAGGGVRFPSYVTIIATAENTDTTVTVRSTANIEAGNGVNAMAPGQEQTFTLGRGDTLTLQANDGNNNDLSGTTIEATAPIAAFAGLPCANVPVGLARCDHMEQQLYPTNSWGDTYILAKFRPRGTENDVYRVIAAEDGTLIETSPEIAGAHSQTLDRGQVLQFQTRQSFELRARNSISGAGAPVSVGQFMVGAFDSGVPRTCPAGCGGLFDPCSWGIGDPSYMLAVPVRQYLDDYVFFVPADYRENAISIMAPSGADVRLNGNPVNLGQGTAIPGIPWVVAHTNVPEGVNRLTADRAVGLNVYGYDCNVSYAYPGGLNLGALP